MVPNRPKRTDKDYGTPIPGSKTEARGVKAHERVAAEILELCIIILENADIRSNDASRCHGDDTPLASIKFGRLFLIYNHVSNKLVGLLLRARKYGLVRFVGETLFQGRDDNVRVDLLQSPTAVRDLIKVQDKTLQWGKCM